MKEKKIVIEIDEQGNCSMDLEGFQRKGLRGCGEGFPRQRCREERAEQAGVLHPRDCQQAATTAILMAEAHGGKTC